MIVSLIVALLFELGPTPTVGALQQAPAAQRPAPASSPVPATTPASPATADDAPAAPRDPAEVVISTPRAVMLVPVKASLIADYEAALTLLQGAMASTSDAEARTVAGGWTVMKATEADSKGNVVYVHLLNPVVAGVDYRPSVWLDRLVKDLPLDVLDKYRDALAGPASLLSLTDVASMADPPAPAGTAAAGGATPPGAQSAPVEPAPTTPNAPAVKRPGGPRR